ncbi:MAG: nucleotidyltransferase [Anaerolineae bacterium]|nr:nucleotidyltransferase [Anaerolineae bacterium]
MAETLKIAIPMAGFGSRLRPHTWSKPKPLIQLAGKTVLDYVLEQFSSLPDPQHVEYVFIVGPQGGQIKAHMDFFHPDKVVHYVYQTEMRGQSDALYQAREFLHGPMLMCFSDTLIETDLSFLAHEEADAVALVKPVPDPRRFGVAQVDAHDWIQRFVEKPQDLSNNLVLVGFYYFRSSEMLIDAIREQMRRQIMLKGEYFLADAANILLEQGARFRVQRIETWLDAGTQEALLETNLYLLNHGHANNPVHRPGVSVIPPVFINDTAQIKSSVIGPNVSIGANCQLEDVIIRNSIIDAETQLQQMILENSLLGSYVQIRGQASSMSLGDNAIWTT